MPTILVLFTLLFRDPLCVLTDGLAERIILCDLLAKAAAADNLLFRLWGFLKRHAAFPVQLSHRSLKNHGEIFPDEGRICQGQSLMPSILNLRAMRFPTTQISSSGSSESRLHVR